MKRLLISIVAGLSALLMACGPGNEGGPTVNPEYGVVESVVLVSRGRDNTVAGTVAGAVIGGIVGHQVGSGRGNDAATVAGAVGGAYVGQQLAKERQTSDLYEVTVRMEDGSYHSLVISDGRFVVGQPVRVVNGTITPR